MPENSANRPGRTGSTWAGSLEYLPIEGSFFPGRGSLVEQSFLTGKARGVVQGCAASIIMVLEARGITVRYAQRRRISECMDINVLDRWLTQALTLTDAGELFTGEGPANT
jgi:hypothetical protein